MDKLKEIYNYVLNYIKIAYDYCYPYVVELYNYAINNEKESIIILTIVWMLLRIHRKIKRKLKKKKFKKAKLANSKQFYNTGFRCEFTYRDIIKFKLKFSDYCDKKGIRYYYFFNIKLLGLEFLRTKYIDQKGAIYKRKVTFRS